jgi:membrane protein required for colicin V production
MNGFDIGILLLAVLFGVRGFLQGLIVGLFGLVGMLVGFFLAVRSMGEISMVIDRILSIGPPVSSVIALVLVYSVVTLVFHLLGRFLGSWLHRLALGLVDRIGGFALGAVKGFLVASVLLLVLTLIPLPPGVQEEREDSWLAKPIGTFAPATFNFFKHLVPSTENLMDEWNQGMGKTTKHSKEQDGKEAGKTHS